MLNTINSTLKIYGSMIRKYSPLKFKNDSVENVMNYLNYSDTLSSSGQPAKNQFSVIQKAGYDIVINIATYDFLDNPQKGEEAIVKKLGMDYVHIPVDFFKPTEEDFKKFAKIMEYSSGKKVWVHCAANARASAFIFRYRCRVMGEDSENAKWDVREIWEPFGAWKKLISW